MEYRSTRSCTLHISRSKVSQALEANDIKTSKRPVNSHSITIRAPLCTIHHGLFRLLRSPHSAISSVKT